MQLTYVLPTSYTCLWQQCALTRYVNDTPCYWHLMSICTPSPLALASPVKSRLCPPWVDNICQCLAWSSARSCGSGGRCGITICKQYVVMVLDVLWNSCSKVLCLAHPKYIISHSGCPKYESDPNSGCPKYESDPNSDCPRYKSVLFRIALNTHSPAKSRRT